MLVEGDLKSIPLSETTRFIVDNRGKSVPVVNNGMPLIATNCIDNNYLYPVYSNLRYITEETYKNWFRSHPLPGDIILTLKGSQNGAVCLVPNPVDFVMAQDMVALRANEDVMDPLFLFAALRSEEVQNQIKNLDVSGVIPHLKKSDFNKVFIPCPDLSSQKIIGDFYYTMSKKIDLLHRNNKTLEQIAETLFRQWFVVEAKEKWETVKLKDFVTTVIDNRGKTPPTVEYKTVHPLIEVNAINSDNCLIDYSVIRKYLEDDVYKTWFRKHLKKNDLIVSTVGTIGVFSLFLNEVGAIAQNLIGLRCTHPFFLYTWLKNNKELLLSLDIGGVQPSIKVPHLLDLELNMPAKDLLDRFEKQIEPLFDKLIQNQKQIYSLTLTRNTLLPKLMSGQVKVNT